MGKSKSKKRNPFASYLREPSLFDDDESTFVDNFSRRRVYVHLVPAPWSRVLLLSLVYALAINFVKLGWFEFFGRPQLYAASEEASAATESSNAATQNKASTLAPPAVLPKS